MIDIGFSTTPDYTGLNPPKFVKISKIYNTVLIPKHDVPHFVQPADTISFGIDNRTIKQKVGLHSGFITLYNKEYYYFYIIPGFPSDAFNKKSYSIFIGDKQLSLNTFFDSSYSAKLINGLLILPNNFNYTFNHTNYSIVLANNKNLFTNIIKQDNKYNYYMANTNNTLLYILNSQNTTSLYELNNSFQDAYIRPLFNKNYPLGSCKISAKGVSNYRLLFGNNIFRFKDSINIDHLPAGQYKIVFLDNKDNPITINTVNNNIIQQDSFNISIDRRQAPKTTQSSILTVPYLDKPDINYSNLVINLKPYHTTFELFGPQNFARKYNTGFQQLHNIIPGEYYIKYQDINVKILVIKNDNNYFSNQ